MSLIDEHRVIIYDFEVFPKDWLVCFRDWETGEEWEIINEQLALFRFQEEHSNDIFIGYNSRSYDLYIYKGIILNYNPYFVNNEIILHNKKGFQVVTNHEEVQFYNYDTQQPNMSLKQIEGFMGSEIKESEIPFNIQRKLTPEELNEVLNYCRHDVRETTKVLEGSIGDFQSHLLLIETFKLPLSYLTKTKAQLSAIVLGAKKETRNDEWDIVFPDTIRISEKYMHVWDWFKNPRNRSEKKGTEYVTEIAGVEHVFAWGGVHGAKYNYVGEGLIVHCDVASLYPSIMIEYNLLSRNVSDPSKFKEIRDQRIIFKKAKDVRQAPLKIVLNSTYGASNDIYNPLYDPRQAHSVCAAGQLFLLDLIEKLEDYCTLIQSNTDGLFLAVKDQETLVKIKEIAKEWETRTRLDLDWEIVNKIVQKDVNNYLIVEAEDLNTIDIEQETNPEIKNKGYTSKGSYLKKLSKIDYDLAIVNKALKHYFIFGTPVEDYINSNDNLIDFQKIVKNTSKYKGFVYGSESLPLNVKFMEWVANTKDANDEPFKYVPIELLPFIKTEPLKDKHLVFLENLDDLSNLVLIGDLDHLEYPKDYSFLQFKVHRVFATKDINKSTLYKVHGEKGVVTKVPNVPEHCEIINESVIDKKCPDWLDKEYYIDMAKKRIADYIEPRSGNSKSMKKSGIKFVSYKRFKIVEDFLEDDLPMSFSESVMYLINEKKIDKRSIEILIKLDFFEKFGRQIELLKVLDFMELFKFGTVNSIAKTKFQSERTLTFVLNYGNDLLKSGKIGTKITDIKYPEIFKEFFMFVKSMNLRDLSWKLKIASRFDYTGDIFPTEKESHRPILYVTDMRPLNRKKDNVHFGYGITTTSLGSGKVSKFTVFLTKYKKEPFQVNDVIYCKNYDKNERGYYTLYDYYIMD